MLAPEELASLRGVAVRALSAQCDVVRMVTVRLPNNSTRRERQVVYTGVACRKVPTGQTPQELALIQSLRSMNVTAFLLPPTIQVYADDIIVHEGVDYPVAGTLTRTDQIYLRVMAYDHSSAVPNTP